MNSTINSELHVVLGAGQVGPLLASELAERGLRVRLVRRGPPNAQLAGVEWMRGDLTDPEFAASACAGAAVVYNCSNPEHYHRWEQLLLPLSRGILNAAAQNGARLVVLDNLYMMGAPDQVPFDESVPMNPCSQKGELRKRLVEEHLEAHARGRVKWTSGRAADFFGPGAGSMAALGERLAQRIAAGKAIELFGNPSLPRSYSFIPDVAHGLATLGTRSESWGQAWHLPIAWKQSTLDLLRALGAQLGEPVRSTRVPDFMLSLAGLVSPLLGAVREMTYQWKVPFVVDDRRFRETFGVEPTSASDAVRLTAAALRPQIDAIRAARTHRSASAVQHV